MFLRTRAVMNVVMMATLGIAAPQVCLAQSVSAADRESLVRLHVDRGGRGKASTRSSESPTRRRLKACRPHHSSTRFARALEGCRAAAHRGRHSPDGHTSRGGRTAHSRIRSNTRPRAGRARRHTSSGGIRRRCDDRRSERVDASGAGSQQAGCQRRAGERGQGTFVHQGRSPAVGRRHRSDGRGCETGDPPITDSRSRARGQTPRDRLSSGARKPSRIARRDRARRAPRAALPRHTRGTCRTAGRNQARARHRASRAPAT